MNAKISNVTGMNDEKLSFILQFLMKLVTIAIVGFTK